MLWPIQLSYRSCVAEQKALFKIAEERNFQVVYLRQYFNAVGLGQAPWQLAKESQTYWSRFVSSASRNLNFHISKILPQAHGPKGT